MVCSTKACTKVNRPGETIAYQVGIQSRLQVIEQRLEAEVGHLGQELDLEVAPDDRGGAEHSRRIVAQIRYTPAHDFPH